MDDQDEFDDFTFETPAEESDEYSPVAKIDGSGDLKLLTTVADASPTSPSHLASTVKRLVLSQERPKRLEGAEEEPSNLDESKKSVAVAGLLRKLGSVDTFFEADVSYPYWRTLAYLCSLNGDSNPTAVLSFVQEGGIPLAVRTLHDFVVLGRKDDESFGIVTEILRCLATMYGGGLTHNIDMECVSDILASMINLRQWDLAKTVQIGSKESMQRNIKEIKAIIGQKLTKDTKKLSIIFPSIMPTVGATDFDMNLLEFQSDETSNIDDGVWKLRPRMEMAANSPTREPETIQLISKLNSVAFLAADKSHEEKLNEISSVVKRLIDEDVEFEPYMSKPMLGTVCMILNDGEEGIPYRALVVSLECGRSEVVVFAVDLGFTKKVQVELCYRLPVELMEIKPAIFICLLRNAVPAPHAAVFDEALKVFHNLSSCWTSSKNFLKTNVIDALLLTLRLIDQEPVVEMGLKILTNLASPSIGDRDVILERGTLEQLFLLGSELTEKSEDPTNVGALNLLQRVIECLTNLVKYNQSARRKLADMKGTLLPNVILSHHGKDTAIHQAALNLTNALFSASVASGEFKETVKQWTGNSSIKKECSALNKLLMDALKVKGGKIRFDACFTPEMAKSSVQSPLEALKPSPEVQDILRRVAVPLASNRFYLKGVNAKLSGDGHWNVICDDVTDLNSLKTRFIQELCCAALNSRQRLTVYFGLEKDGNVRGIRVNQWDIDGFRLGIDWSLSRAFRPFLEPTMYNAEFVPVCMGEHQSQPIQDLFVVELKILHISTEVYQLDKDGSVYLRIDDQVVQMNLQEAGTFFAHQINEEKKKNLLRMRQQIAVVKALIEKCDG